MGAEMSVEVGRADKRDEKHKLLAFGFAHSRVEFLDVAASAFAPVETADLEHTPESAFDGRLAVDFHRGLEFGPHVGLPLRSGFVKALVC